MQSQFCTSLLAVSCLVFIGCQDSSSNPFAPWSIASQPTDGGTDSNYVPPDSSIPPDSSTGLGDSSPGQDVIEDTNPGPVSCDGLGTPLSGSVSGDLGPGDFCVNDHVLVPAGSVLRIQPGSTFVVIGRYRFGANRAGNDSGSLEAIGTESSPIVFRGATKDTRWYGLAFIHAENVVLEHVTIQDAWKDDDNPNQRIWRRGGALGSIGMSGGTVIRHCTFKNNYARDVGGAIDVNSTALEITDSRFEENHTDNDTADEYGGGAIRFHHIASKNVQRNVFVGNYTAGVGGALAHFDSAIELRDNEFIKNKAALGSGAIRCSEGKGFTFGSASNNYWGNRFQDNQPDIGCGIQ